MNFFSEHLMFNMQLFTLRQGRWNGLGIWLILALAILLPLSSEAETNEQRSLVLVVGAAGEAEFGEQFSTSLKLWKEAGVRGRFATTVIGEQKENPENDRTRLLQALTNEVSASQGELWLVLIGHGTFDGRTAKFNLRGPDLSSEELAATLKKIQRPLAVIQCASASGPFLSALSGSNQVIITATRSGNELNATRLGNYLARAVGDAAADLDKDGQTSLLEAYLMASRQTEQFYKEAGRLASEHALLDDNGDGLGTPADWFHGVRATKSAADGKSVDGVRAHQLNLVRSEVEQKLPEAMRARRDALEKKLSDLRARKGILEEEIYYRQLESLLVEIARLYQNE